jgi:hypothetical protein
MQQPQLKRQRTLFEETSAPFAIQLPLDVQQQLRQALVQWMQALAKRIQQEDSNEQDHI